MLGALGEGFPLAFKFSGNSRIRPKRKRMLALLAMPFAVLIWCMGWGLFWVSEDRRKIKPKVTAK